MSWFSTSVSAARERMGVGEGWSAAAGIFAAKMCLVSLSMMIERSLMASARMSLAPVVEGGGEEKGEGEGQLR
jgi:hypothetical protein